MKLLSNTKLYFNILLRVENFIDNIDINIGLRIGNFVILIINIGVSRKDNVFLGTQKSDRRFSSKRMQFLYRVKDRKSAQLNPEGLISSGYHQYFGQKQKNGDLLSTIIAPQIFIFNKWKAILLIVISNFCIANTIFSQDISLDSFIQNPNQFTNSKYVFIGELHGYSRNNKLYFSLFEKKLSQGTDNFSIILEYHPVDILFYKTKIAEGDSLTLFKYAKDSMLWKFLFKKFYKKSVNNIPIIGIGIDNYWWGNINLLKKSLESFLIEENKSIQNLKKLVDEPYFNTKKLTITKIVEIADFILNDSYFKDKPDFLIIANTFKVIIDNYGLRKIKNSNRDLGLYQNLIFVNNLYKEETKFIGILGFNHLLNEQINKRESLILLNKKSNQNLSISSVRIYYKHEFKSYEARKDLRRFKNKNSNIKSLYGCNFEDQFYEEYKNNTIPDLIKLNSCFDFLYIHIENDLVEK